MGKWNDVLKVKWLFYTNIKEVAPGRIYWGDFDFIYNKSFNILAMWTPLAEAIINPRVSPPPSPIE